MILYALQSSPIEITGGFAMNTFPDNNGKDEGVRLLKENKLDEAITALNQAAKISPDDAQIHMYLGIAYSKKNDKLHAIAEFEESASIQKTPQSCYNLGQIYEQVRRIDESIRQYEAALRMDSEYAPAKQALEGLRQKFAAAHPQPQPVQTAGSGPIPPGGQPAAGAPGATQTMPAQSGYPQNQAPSGPPDFHAEMARRQFEVEEQHRIMMKSGLIYGIICGAGFFFLLHLVGLMFSILAIALGAGGGPIMYMIIGTVKGAIFGGLVGFWVGYTCGGGTAGFTAGAVIGGVFQLVAGLLYGLGSAAILWALVGAFVCGILGCIVGELVDNSIAGV